MKDGEGMPGGGQPPMRAHALEPRHFATVVALLVLALAYRLWILHSLQQSPLFAIPSGDSAMFDAWARDLAENNFWGGDIFFFDPLYPSMLGLFYKIFGHHPGGFTVLQAVIGTLGLLMLFDGARRLFGYPAAISALAAGAFYRTLAFHDVVLAKDFLGAFFMEAAFLAVALAQTEGLRRWWAAAGVACGLAGLVRGNLLIVVPVLAVAAWFAPVRDFRRAGALLAGAAMVLIPIEAYNAAAGVEMTGQTGMNLYIGNHPGNETGRYEPPPFLSKAAAMNELIDFQEEAERRLDRKMTRGEVSLYWRDEGFKAIANEPGRFLLLTVKRVALLTNRVEVPDTYQVDYLARRSAPLAVPAVTFGLAAPLAIYGLVRTRREWPRLLGVYTLFAVSLFSMAIFFVFDRYRLPALPFVALFAGAGAASAWKAWAARDRRTMLAGAVVLLAAVAWVNMPLHRFVNVGRIDLSISHLNDAVSWLRLDQPVNAAREIEAFLKIRPEARADPWIMSVAGRAYEGAGDLARAADHFGAAAISEHDQPQRWVDLARVLLSAQDIDRARKAVDNAETAARRNPPPANIIKTMVELRRQLP